MSRKGIDLTGSVFGKWTVLSKTTGKNMQLCRCTCGRERKVPTGNLTLGLSTQCKPCGFLGMRKVGTAFTQVLNIYKCNAKGRNREWSLSNEEFLELSQQPCHYCGISLSNKQTKPYEVFLYNGIDRKDNAVGYTKDNSLPCCKDCNMRRGTMGYTEFLQWMTRVLNFSNVEYGLSLC